MDEMITATKQDRDARTDALRFIGLICIFIAHTAPPLFLYQLRSFDVPLLVMVSGLSFGLTSKSSESYLSYLKRRAARLVLPVWIFLVIFFAVGYILYTAIGKPFPFSTISVITSFTLDSGIGFVWIIKVLLLTAIISPLIDKITVKLSVRSCLLLLLGLYAFYESIVFTTQYLDSVLIRYFLDNYLFYLFPYGIVAAIGILLPRIQKNVILTLAMFFGIVYLGQAFYYMQKTGHYLQTQMYKSPPQLYYLMYALCFSLLLYLLLENKKLQVFFNNPFVRFVSTSTMWLYLWHIAFIYVAQMFPILQKPYTIYLAYLFVSALIVVYLQKMIIGFVISRFGLQGTAAQSFKTLFLR